MRYSVAAASAALVGVVAAGAHNNHMGFHMRRHYEADVCTVYTTVYVYPSEVPTPVANSTVLIYPTPVPEESSTTPVAESSTPYPEESSSAPAYTPAPAPSSFSKADYTPAPVPSSSKVEYPVSSAPAPTSSKAEYPVSSAQASSSVYEAPTSSSAKPTETGSYGGGGRIVTKGDKWAMTYTPYAANGDCKTQSAIKSDISKIAEMGFTTIRSYSTDCGVFEYVIPACQEHGLKVIYGIFLEAGGKSGKGPFSDYANAQMNDIIDNAPKDSVAMLIVGNEYLFNNYGSAEELGSYIDYVKESLSGAGFPSDIAVTTTEPVNVWEEKGAALCSHIDVFAVQVHPYFTDKVVAKEAGSFAKEQLEQAAKVCPEVAAKGKYISEIGWPKKGSANGAAVPGVEEQKEAMKDILEKVGKESCLFSFQDDLWKAPGSFGVEQSFGCSEAL